MKLIISLLNCMSLNDNITKSELLTISATPNLSERPCLQTKLLLVEHVFQAHLKSLLAGIKQDVLSGKSSMKTGNALQKNGNDTRCKISKCKKCDISVRLRRDNNYRHILSCTFINEQAKNDYQASNATIFPHPNHRILPKVVMERLLTTSHKLWTRKSYQSSQIKFVSH